MNVKSAKFLPCLFAMSFLARTDLHAQQPTGINYDEDKIPPYTLPDALTLASGQKVSDAKTWIVKRRPEILELFQTHVYGRSPGRPAKMLFEVTAMDKKALGGKATRKEVAVYFTGDKQGPKMDILIYLPHDATKPVPAYLGLNFGGNHAVNSDPGIALPEQWVREKDGRIVKQRATEDSRGKESSRWAVDKILARGFALATIFYGDIEPDFVGGHVHGVRAVFRRDGTELGQAPPDFAADDWGAIAAWAWGLSRALDYLETDKDIDAKHVGVMGHSRLGKTSLWAGATDSRFAVVISNDSGEGGAALSRRWFGETVERINTSFPHWFCGNYKKYNRDVASLPVDQHELISLMAPRPVYVASAEDDKWADPRGEFLSAKNAGPVFRLFGKKGLEAEDMPAVNKPAGETIRYHIRTGKHDVTDYDWEQYLEFATHQFTGAHH